MRTLWAAPIAIGMIGLLTACSPSADQLRRAAIGKPGVIDVDVQDNGGEDDIPFASLPWIVTATMEANATEQQIKDVAGAYEDDLEDGDVESLIVAVGDRGHLEMGVTTGATEPWVEALAQGLLTPEVRSLSVFAWAPGPSIEISLWPTDFGDVHEVVQDYRRRYDLRNLSVSSGSFSVSFSGNYAEDDPARADARLRTAAAVDRRFGLSGARVWGSAPLRLMVRPGTDVAQVRTYAERVAPPGTGRVVVVTAAHRSLPEAHEPT